MIKQIFIGIRQKNDIILYLCLAFLFVILIFSLFGEFIAPYDYKKIDIASRLKPPSFENWMGTDNFGRDISSRIIIGSRASILIGTFIAILSSFFGMFLGLIAAMYKRLDNIIMRFLDGLMSFPTVALAIALVAAFGIGMWQTIIALTIIFTPRTARIMRGVALKLKEESFVEYAVASGASTMYITFVHIFRNGTGPLVVQGSFVLAQSILIEAGLSFLGLGVPPPSPTWGNMLGDANTYISTSWWFITFPGLFLLFTVVSINLLGDTLRDILDPRMR